ncbi:MAG TPA: hypothetical protein PLV30_09490, partial [Candidatus Marinimicrobia bacterium]|nr:hypothetical protein [Candidatus Neomarinimicrobiota bacterium]
MYKSQKTSLKSEDQDSKSGANPFPDCLDTADWRKLTALQNQYVEAIVTEYIRLCRPAKVSILSDTPEEIAYVRQLALRTGEEQPLKIAGHTVHFDGYNDQGRDKEHTRILVNDGHLNSERLNTLDRV